MASDRCLIKDYLLTTQGLATISGGFRPGPESTGPLPQFCSRPPVSWPPMIFCKDNTNIWCFCVSKVSKSGQVCGFHWTSKSQKCFSFRGLHPLAPDQGLCPWTPLRALSPDPRYRPARFCGLELPLATIHPWLTDRRQTDDNCAIDAYSNWARQKAYLAWYYTCLKLHWQKAYVYSTDKTQNKWEVIE